MVLISEHVPLSQMTTFEVGGSARYFCEAGSPADIQEAIAWAKERQVAFVILAGGSNVLISDKGVDALVIRISDVSVEWNSQRIAAAAGKNLLALIREAAEHGLGGMHGLAGIPGSVGGAVRGNAGAFGSEIKDFLSTAAAVNSVTGEERTFRNEECEFSYRDSFFKRNPEWIILGAELELSREEEAEVLKKIEHTIAERERRHLQDVRAAGSYFMNPVAPKEIVTMFEQEKGVTARGARVPAGWLIEKAGMKGARVGGAYASDMHPNYLVNDENATSAEVRELAQKIKAAVKEKFGVELQEEAQYLS